jgi:MYXO-CTERM domain-containing protein
MKHIVLSSIVAVAATLLSPQAAQAQGTMLRLSSLSQTYTGTKAVGGDSWLAVPFVTGNSPGGYTLDSVQLGMADASGNPSGFSVMLYSRSGDTGAILPGSSLGSLTGSTSPTSAGVYSYTPAAGLTVSPGTYYFVVLTGTTVVADGAYSWGLSAYPPATGSDGWWEGNEIRRSVDGASGWPLALPYQGIGQLAIYATAVPEPGAFSLAILGGLLLMRRRR